MSMGRLEIAPVISLYEWQQRQLMYGSISGKIRLRIYLFNCIFTNALIFFIKFVRVSCPSNLPHANNHQGILRSFPPPTITANLLLNLFSRAGITLILSHQLHLETSTGVKIIPCQTHRLSRIF